MDIVPSFAVFFAAEIDPRDWTGVTDTPSTEVVAVGVADVSSARPSDKSVFLVQ